MRQSTIERVNELGAQYRSLSDKLADEECKREKVAPKFEAVEKELDDLIPELVGCFATGTDGHMRRVFKLKLLAGTCWRAWMLSWSGRGRLSTHIIHCLRTVDERIGGINLDMLALSVLLNSRNTSSTESYIHQFWANGAWHPDSNARPEEPKGPYERVVHKVELSLEPKDQTPVQLTLDDVVTRQSPDPILTLT